MVISACAPSKRSAANSTFFSSLDLGIGLGAMAWGVVSQALGFPAIFIGCIVIMFFAAIAFLAILNKERGSSQAG
jgi:predicted MFS family arabinose efflux permease